MVFENLGVALSGQHCTVFPVILAVFASSAGSGHSQGCFVEEVKANNGLVP